jgi:hypothetical protein
MVNLIDYTYFRDELQLANTATPEVQTFLTLTISRKQYEFLQLLLGPSLYDQFVTWYGIDPTDTTNNFYYLLNGKTFTVNGCTHNWVGLRVDTLKISPIANYVYFYYQNNNVTQTTSPGEARTNSQNASVANPANKMIDAWSEMVDNLRQYLVFMNTFYGTTGELPDNFDNLPYHAPVQLQAGVTVGLVAGATSFTFDGTAGTPDWRGYDIFPERIGQGTMIRGVGYSWNISTGRFDLLAGGDIFQPGEYFNITFGLGGTAFTQLTSTAEWTNYRCIFERSKLFHKVNFMDL